MSARLPAEDGALLLAAMKAAEDEAITSGAGEDPSQTWDRHPAGARRADALVAVARAALDAGGESRAGSDPCELVVHVDVQSLVGDRIAARAELDDGPAIAPETVRRLGCDAALVKIVEQNGRPLSVSRRTRTISPALRRALRSRDGGCRFPGCTHSRFLHAHHIQHWARGGPTTIDNLVQLCSYHHRLVHEGGFQVERSGRRTLRFRTPDGRPIAPAGPARRARGPGITTQNRTRGLRITDQTCRARSAGDPIDYHLAVELLLERLFKAKPPEP